MWKIRLYFDYRLKLRFLVKLLCISSVFVSANNPWEHGIRQRERELPYRFDAMAVPTPTGVIPNPNTMLPTTQSPSTEDGSEGPSDPRIANPMQMLGMLNGKEKNWSFKKPGLFGSHNVNIKLGAQESIFCRLTKRQTVVMFSFCMQNKGGGMNSGWGSMMMNNKGGNKGGMMSGGSGWPMKPMKGEEMSMGWGEEEMEMKKKKKKKGGKKKGMKKKKGGKKKGGGKKKKGGKGKGGGKKKGGGGGGGGGKGDGGGESEGWGMEKEMEMMEKGGWGQDMKNQGWGPKKKEEKEEEKNEGWSKEQEDNADAEDESAQDEEGEEQEEESSTNNSEEEEEDGQGGTSQSDEYEPKMTTPKPKIVMQQAETPGGGAMYMTESEYTKWEKENSYAQKDKVVGQDLLYHHFYKKY